MTGAKKVTMLQWGHDKIVMEVCYADGIIFCSTVASMGP